MSFFAENIFTLSLSSFRETSKTEEAHFQDTSPDEYQVNSTQSQVNYTY